MRHGFSRFGPPSARERLHRQARGSGSLAMILPTIFVTLFLFVVVVTLNKAGSISRGGKIIRLLSVEDVFPSQDLETNRKKEFWEQPPPPTPREGGSDLPEGFRSRPPVFEEPRPLPVFVPVAQPAAVPSRTLTIETREIEMPDVAPDTEIAPQPAPPKP